MVPHLNSQLAVGLFLIIIINGLPSTSDLVVFIRARYLQSKMMYSV